MTDTTAPLSRIGWRARWGYLRHLVTVEPMLACYITALTITSTAYDTFKLEKACVTLDSPLLNASVCAALVAGATDVYATESQLLTDASLAIDVWLEPCLSVIPLALSLLWGAFSDRYRVRKIFLILPLFGQLLSASMWMVSVYWMREMGLATSRALIQLVGSLFGGASVLVVAIFAYVVDVSSVEERTARVAFAQIVMRVVSVLCQPLSAILFRHLHYYGIGFLYILFSALGLLYCALRIHDRGSVKQLSWKRLLLELFDPRFVADLFRVLLVPKEGNKRLLVLASMLIFILVNITGGSGTSTFYYLFTFLQFNTHMWTYLLTFATLMHLSGSIAGTFIFTTLLHFTDYLIMIVAFLGEILRLFVFCVANSATVIYIGVFVGLFNNMLIIALRSLASKSVGEDDNAKAQSFFGVSETIGAIAGGPLFAAVYRETQETHPTVIFYLEAFLNVVLIAMTLGLYVHYRRFIARVNEERKTDDSQGCDNKGMSMIETTHI